MAPISLFAPKTFVDIPILGPMRPFVVISILGPKTPYITTTSVNLVHNAPVELPLAQSFPARVPPPGPCWPPPPIKKKTKVRAV